MLSLMFVLPLLAFATALAPVPPETTAQLRNIREEFNQILLSMEGFLRIPQNNRFGVVIAPYMQNICEQVKESKQLIIGKDLPVYENKFGCATPTAAKDIFKTQYSGTQDNYSKSPVQNYKGSEDILQTLVCIRTGVYEKIELELQGQGRQYFQPATLRCMLEMTPVFREIFKFMENLDIRGLQKFINICIQVFSEFPKYCQNCSNQ